MKSYRYLARFVALLVILTLALFISSMLVAAQDANPGADPKAPQADGDVYLPLISKPPNTIYGHVTDEGSAAPGVTLKLLLYNAGDWSLVMTTTTNANGDYFFKNMPALAAGQKYLVEYWNEDDPSRLNLWDTRELTSFPDGSVVNIGDFDIANVALAAPAHLSLVTLPRIFTWTARPASPTDSYVFELFDYNDSNPFFSSAYLGYAAGYNLTSLPAGFLNCIPYAWGLTIHSPDGGLGVPYWYNAVTFYPTTPSGIHGCVAESGVPKSGIQLKLYRLNINTQDVEDMGTTNTNASGYFAFTGKPSLVTGYGYFVQYPNNENDTDRLLTWYTRGLAQYAAGSSVHIGDFDIKNVALVAPINSATVNLPETFSWVPRPGLQSDSYEFNLIYYPDYVPWFYTDPLLGYINQYTLTGLPAGFNLSTPYQWEIWTYSPYDDAYGLSYESRIVTFSPAAMSVGSTGTLTDAQRGQIGYQRMLRRLQAEPQAQPGLRPNFEQQPGQ